ncbi:MAG: hypothetical protein JWM96_66 [Alphaproteobacteria bacterium]|nr:hypothetical protein [Alphaproteobacteria bacterium]
MPNPTQDISANDPEMIDLDLPAIEEIPFSELVSGDDQDAEEDASQVQGLYDSADDRPYGTDQGYVADEDDEGRNMGNDRSFRRDDDALTPDPANYDIEDVIREEEEAAKQNQI